MLKWRYKPRWLVSLAVCLLYLPQFPGCMVSHAPKFGRVIDADTGKGLAGVSIIASASVTTWSNFSLIPESIIDTTTEYRVVAITDSDGQYWIPNTWDKLSFFHFVPIFPNFRQEWQLVAFKPGMVTPVDEKRWANEEIYGRPFGVKPYSAQPTTPEIFLWVDVIAWIKPIELHTKFVETKDAAQYASSTIDLGKAGTQLERSRRNATSEEIATSKMTYDFFLPKICALNADEKIDWGYSVASVDDWSKFYARLSELEPTSRKEAQEHGDSLPRYDAKTVCEAMKFGGAPK